MKLFLFLLPYLFTGLAVSIAAVLIERLLILAGWTPGNTVTLVIMIFIATVLWQLIKFPKPISFDIDILFVLFIGLMSANRFHFIRTFEQGKWWWKTKSDEQK